MGSGVNLRLNLSLIEDEEEGIVIPSSSSNQHSGTGSNDLLVVGRLLSHQSSNFEALKNSLMAVLQPVKGMSVWRISEERFCLKFNHRLDFLRALEGRPWVFDKNLIILEQVGNNDKPEEVCLDWCPFTIFVHDLPLTRQTGGIAEHIGNKLGQFIDMELSKQGHNWSSAWKLRISLNTSQPLKRALRLQTLTGADLLVTFTYARLTNFYYLCGKISHIAKYCPLRYEEDFVDPGDAAPYGPWLRANHQDRYIRSLIGSSRSSQNQSLRPKFHSSDSLFESWRRESPARGPAIFGNFSKPIYGKKAINQEEDSSPINSISCHTYDNLYGKT
ncbi:UNVERIFIED_CONTAM: hypothetical protein Scaly_0101500 [Sesamum calycinum]|uniref:DUF4283 domain-containing protein n=1 Tax=Sesamum calycinum TaxID=2727403 RepID=A0AAW2SV70_9LAMI